jgi:hypothetical protein
MSENRKKILDLLGEGYAQTRVASILKITRQAVSKHALALVKSGHLRPIRGTKSPRLYRRTSKPYKVVNRQDHRGWSPLGRIRSHHTSRLFKITHPPTRPFPWLWDNEWMFGSVHHHHARNLSIETSEGKIVVKGLRWSEGPKSSSITIWNDEDDIKTPEEIAVHSDISTEKAILVASEVQRLTGMRLALPEIMQKTHLALDAPPEIVKSALENDLKGEKTWFDRSKGGSEIETDDEEIAITWLNLPDILKSLRSDLNQVKTTVESIGGYLKDNTEALQTIAEGLKEVDKRTKFLEGAEIADDPPEMIYQ